MHRPTSNWDVHFLVNGRPFVHVELDVVKLLPQLIQQKQICRFLYEFTVLVAKVQVETEVLIDFDRGGADGIVLEGLGLFVGVGPDEVKVTSVGDFEVFDVEFARTLVVFLVFIIESAAQHLRFNLSFNFLIIFNLHVSQTLPIE